MSKQRFKKFWEERRFGDGEFPWQQAPRAPRPDDEPLDAVGTNEDDSGRPHAGGSKGRPVLTAEEDRMMRYEKRYYQTPLAVIQYDDHGNQLLVTNIDETRLKRKKD